jgi:type IV pilus assembly protein PilW
MTRASRHGGFTLIELLVAMGIGLMMTAVIITVFAQSTRTSTVNQAGNEIQEQARVALDMLQRDVRQAGYVGCNSNRLLGSGGWLNTIAAPGGYLNNIERYVQGYEGTGASFTPAAPAQVTGATPGASPINDAITVRVPVGEPMPVSGTMAASTSPVPVFSTAGFVANVTRAVVSDCGRSRAFVVTGLVGGLQHNGAANAIPDFGTALGNGAAFGPQATVVAIETISYYVAPSAFSGENSLYRRVGTANPSEEVAEGVEDFQITYGQDTDGDIFADIFTPADAVVDWTQVVSVRASLLIRSKADSMAQTTQSYNFNGATSVAPPDRRLRRPFNVTIQLRNRTI